MDGFSKEAFHELLNLNSFVPLYKPPRSWGGKRVLVYRRGGYGDQLITSALLHYLKHIGAVPFACCSHASDYMDLWAHAFGAPIVLPASLDLVWRSVGKPFIDISLFLEIVQEYDRRIDQPNCYDQLFEKVGFVSKDVPERFKKPFYTVNDETINAVGRWISQLEVEEHKDINGGYIYFQPLAAYSPRSIPFHVIKTILDALENKGIVMIGHNKQFDPEILELIARYPNVINVATMLPDFSSLAAVVSAANAVICPDSACLHLAAAFDKPCVSIFGPYNPDSRALYYKHNVSIWHQNSCRKSPCYMVNDADTGKGLPLELCPKGKEQRWCECFDGITVEEVNAALCEAQQYALEKK